MSKTYEWEYDHEDEWRFMLEGEEYSMTLLYDEYHRTVVKKELMDKLLNGAGAYKYEEGLTK